MPIYLLIGGVLTGLILVQFLPREVVICSAIICCILLRSKLALLALIAFVMGISRYDYLYHDTLLSLQHKFGRELATTAVVVRETAMNDYQQIVTVQINRVEFLTQLQTNKYPTLYPGDVVNVAGTLAPLPANRTDGFDYTKYLNSQQIFSTVNHAQLHFIHHDQGINGWANGVRVYVTSHAKAALLEPERSLFSGLLIGGSDDFSPQLQESMQRSGTSHLVSISGYNISLVLGMLFALAGLIPRRWLMYISPFLLLFFLQIVGASNLSAARAAVMGIFVMICLLTGRKGGVWLGIIYAAVFLIFDNPLVINDVSFQLSFAALAGVILLPPRLKLLIKLPTQIQEIVCVTLAATIATFPVIWLNFGGISFISVFVNFILIPLVGFLTIYEIAALVVYSLLSTVGSYLFYYLRLVLTFIITIITTASNFQFAYSEDKTAIVVFGILLLTMVLICDYKYYAKQNF